VCELLQQQMQSGFSAHTGHRSSGSSRKDPKQIAEMLNKAFFMAFSHLPSPAASMHSSSAVVLLPTYFPFLIGFKSLQDQLSIWAMNSILL
jgi:hypothetical protein